MSGGLLRGQPPPEDPSSENPAPGKPVSGELPHVTLWRLRRNPLRRPTDLLQAWIGLGLLPAVPAAALAALFLVGDAAFRHYARQAEHQERTGRRITAVLLQDAPGHPGQGTQEAAQVRVRFTGPDGLPRIARADVPAGLPAGSGVEVWTGPDGRVTGPPMTDEQIRSRSRGWAILAALAVCAAGAAGYGLAALVLRHRNLSAWAAAWSRTAPRWTESR